MTDGEGADSGEQSRMDTLRPEDVVPLEGGAGHTVRSTLHAITTFAVSTGFRKAVMRAAEFPLSGDLTAFLTVNQLVYRGGARPRDLADALDTGRSNISKVLGRLESAGLVTRGRDPSDGRSVVVVLTARGRAVGARILDAVDRSTRLTRDWSDDDVAELTRLLIRLAADLDALPEHPLRAATGIDFSTPRARSLAARQRSSADGADAAG